MGMISAVDSRFVTSNRAFQRLDAVSSGETMRKLRASAFCFITSRRYTPITRVDSASVTPGFGTSTRVIGEIRQLEVFQQQTAIGVRVRAHAPLALRRKLRVFRAKSPVFVEELFGVITSHPILEHLQFIRARSRSVKRNLMSAERALDGLAVKLLGAGPALRRTQNDHRPQRALAEAIGRGRLSEWP